MASALPLPAACPLPRNIQGGMGVGVSSWRLERRLGGLGVVAREPLGLVGVNLPPGQPLGTDGRVRGTGFPFKVVEMVGTLGLPKDLAGRRRICDLGYLRQAYVDERGRVQGRCPAEPVADYVRKGGRRRTRSGGRASATGSWRTSG